MVLKLEDFMGDGGECCPLLGVILSFVFLVELGAHFRYFSLFLKKGSVCFHESLQRYSWYYSGNHTKIIWNVAFVLQGYFKVF